MEQTPAVDNQTKPSTAHLGGHANVALVKNVITRPAVAQDEDSWVLTYIDVITLLLTLFVMLLAFSSQNQYGFKNAQGALKGGVSRPAEAQTQTQKQIIQKKIQQFSARLQQEQMTKDVSYHLEEGKLVIQFGEKILFPSAEAALTGAGENVMQQVLPVLADSDYTIVIEGHTDNLPIANARFASNWELSSARAAAVVRYLVEHGIEPVRLSAVGFADTRPIGDNGSEAGRARNRRVTFSVSYEQ